MAKTFMQMVEEAMAEVEGVSPNEVQQRMQQDTNALLVDVRDAAGIPWVKHLARDVAGQGGP
jgi:hypothetical protein